MDDIGAFENSVIDSTPIFDDWKGSDIAEMRSSYSRHAVYAKIRFSFAVKDSGRIIYKKWGLYRACSREVLFLRSQ